MLTDGRLMTQEKLADDEFEHYDFGEGVQVCASDNWDKNDAHDFTKIVYVRFDDDAPNEDSERVSFHVRFAPDGSVNDVYGLLMRNGSEIGSRHNRRALHENIARATP